MIIPGGRKKKWWVSSHSQEGNNCVEVGIVEDEIDVALDEVFVRDTKDREGGEISLPASGWRGLIGKLREK